MAPPASRPTTSPQKKAPQPAKPADSAKPKSTPPPKLDLRYKPTLTDKFTGLFFNPNYALTHNLDYSHDSTGRKVGRLATNIGLLLLGVASSVAAHEMAHFIVAKAVGLQFHWPSGGFDGPLIPLWRLKDRDANGNEIDPTAGKRAGVAAAGFIASVLTTELILWVPQIPKDNLFVVGFLLTSIFNNLFYPITDAILKGSRGVGYGDIQVLREAGANVAQIHIPLILHSLLALARLFLLSKKFKGRFNPWAKPYAAGGNLVLLRW